jgi:hypothetical protein
MGFLPGRNNILGNSLPPPPPPHPVPGAWGR